MSDLGKLVRVVSIRGSTAVVGVALVVLGLLAAGAYFMKFGDREPKPMYLIAGISAVIGGVGNLWFTTTSAAIHEGGIAVHKVFSRREIGWSQITRVEASTGGALAVWADGVPVRLDGTHANKTELAAFGTAVAERAQLAALPADPQFAFRAAR